MRGRSPAGKSAMPRPLSQDSLRELEDENYCLKLAVQKLHLALASYTGETSLPNSPARGVSSPSDDSKVSALHHQNAHLIELNAGLGQQLQQRDLENQKLKAELSLSKFRSSEIACRQQELEAQLQQCAHELHMARPEQSATASSGKPWTHAALQLCDDLLVSIGADTSEPQAMLLSPPQHSASAVGVAADHSTARHREELEEERGNMQKSALLRVQRQLQQDQGGQQRELAQRCVAVESICKLPELELALQRLLPTLGSDTIAAARQVAALHGELTVNSDLAMELLFGRLDIIEQNDKVHSKFGGHSYGSPLLNVNTKAPRHRLAASNVASRPAKGSTTVKETISSRTKSQAGARNADISARATTPNQQGIRRSTNNKSHTRACGQPACQTVTNGWGAGRAEGNRKLLGHAFQSAPPQHQPGPNSAFQLVHNAGKATVDGMVRIID